MVWLIQSLSPGIGFKVISSILKLRRDFYHQPFHWSGIPSVTY